MAKKILSVLLSFHLVAMVGMWVTSLNGDAQASADQAIQSSDVASDDDGLSATVITGCDKDKKCEKKKDKDDDDDEDDDEDEDEDEDEDDDDDEEEDDDDDDKE